MENCLKLREQSVYHSFQYHVEIVDAESSVGS